VPCKEKDSCSKKEFFTGAYFALRASSYADYFAKATKAKKASEDKTKAMGNRGGSLEG